MNFKKLQWPTILPLSLLGAVMGGLSLASILTTLGELGAWVIVALIWVAVVLIRRDARPFVTILIVGTLAGVWTGVIQGAFAHILADNPVYAIEGTVTGMTRLVFGFSALAIGIVWGALFGAVAALIRRFSASRETLDASRSA